MKEENEITRKEEEYEERNKKGRLRSEDNEV